MKQDAHENELGLALAGLVEPLLRQEYGLVRELSRQFDRFWMGDRCRDCTFRKECPDPI